MDFGVIKDIVIASTAFVGMILGIYNLVVARNKDKLKLSVIPKAVLIEGHDAMGREAHTTTPHRIDAKKLSKYIAIEIINKSNFDVTLDNVGFTSKDKKNRATIYQPIPTDKGKWPRRLGSRDSVTVYALLEALFQSEHLEKLQYAFVDTACENSFTGDSEALSELVKFGIEYVEK